MDAIGILQNAFRIGVLERAVGVQLDGVGITRALVCRGDTVEHVLQIGDTALGRKIGREPVDKREDVRGVRIERGIGREFGFAIVDVDEGCRQPEQKSGDKQREPCRKTHGKLRIPTPQPADQIAFHAVMRFRRQHMRPFSDNMEPNRVRVHNG